MKTILIIGKNSYIGSSLCEYLTKFDGLYKVDKISVRSDDWRRKTFSEYDVVVYTAGIVHINETKENEHLYYKVNRDIALEVAVKAKREGSNHFIFISSMSVYGIDVGNIDINTTPSPKSIYGKSKLEAENLIKELEDNYFNVSIIRPPMVYGKNCKGNFYILSTFALKSMIFPDISNERSMIYIENLLELLRIVIDNRYSGLFLPQNEDFICTSNMILVIRRLNNRRIFLIPGFKFIISILSKKYKIFLKIFGDLTYSKEISNLELRYNIVNFEESIRKSI